MPEYDVVVIGGGPGGYVGAIRAAQRGARTAVVEKEFLGGTCLNWGCIPTKTLIASSDVLAACREAESFGVRVQGTVEPDWGAMMKRKDKIVGTLRKGIGGLLKSNGVEVYQGTGSFVDRHTVQVRPEAGGDPVALTTKATIIASGSDSVKPGFIPEAANIIYSREALAADSLPETMLVLGGGVIGCEFACLYARLGVKVTVVEMLPEIMPMADADAVGVVRKAMAKDGITIRTSSRMSDIESDGKRVTARVGDETLVADQLLVCIGRRAVSEGMNLPAIGLLPNEAGRIDIDDRCRTRVPGVYAIGDVASLVQLAHYASAQGICAANNATGLEDRFDGHLVPSCIFTSPEIGAVGLTEAEARDQGIEVKVGTFPFAALGKAMAIHETEGFVKLVTDAGTDQVIGAHIVGPHATDLIAEVATAMALEVTAVELGKAIHAHPTLAESVMEAAHAVHDECIHLPRSRRKP